MRPSPLWFSTQQYAYRRTYYDLTPPITEAYADLLLAEQARRAEEELCLSYTVLPAHAKERVRCLDPAILKARIEMARLSVRVMLERLHARDIDRERAREYILFNLRHWRQSRRQLKALYEEIRR